MANQSNPEERVFRIGISGSYGGLNLGDEAILQSIVTQLRASAPCEIMVFSRDAKDTAARHLVERTVPVRDLARDEVRPEVADLDLLILGGGGILYDDAATVYLREVVLAQEHHVPVLVYAVSAGLLQDATARALVRDTLSRADPIPGAGQIAPIAGTLITRSYSRGEEYAADRHSVELLQRMGRSKDVMINTLTWLMNTAGPDGGGGFLSTHPATRDRIQELRRL